MIAWEERKLHRKQQSNTDWICTPCYVPAWKVRAAADSSIFSRLVCVNLVEGLIFSNNGTMECVITTLDVNTFVHPKVVLARVFLPHLFLIRLDKRKEAQINCIREGTSFGRSNGKVWNSSERPNLMGVPSKRLRQTKKYHRGSMILRSAIYQHLK